MKTHNIKLSLVALTVAASFQANADVRINGFANLTAGVVTDDTLVFGQGEDVDFSNASLFALQVAGDIADNVTATAQIIARGENDYSADFEWAYLSYTPNDNSTFTAGRFRLPVFRYSASLDVGYSYHWITAPKSVYDVAFNNLNGIRYDYANYSGDFEYLAQFSYGNYENDIAGGSNKGTDVILASFEGNYNSFKGRLVYGQGDNLFSSTELDTTFAAFSSGVAAALGGVELPVVANLIDDLALDGDIGVFLGVGLEYDNFDWFISGEWTTVDIEDAFSPEDTAYYVTAGMRFGKWTPHITYQTRDGRGDIKFTERYAQVPEPLLETVAGFNTAIQARFFEEYALTTVGVRYDAATNLAIKAEVSQYKNEVPEALGVFDPDSNEDTTLLNVSVNFVF